MAPTHKLGIRFGLLLMVTITGAITVVAQTHAVADNSATSEPIRAEVAKPPLRNSVKCAPAKDGLTHADQVEPGRGCNFAERTSSDPVPTPQSAASEDWQFQVTPYFWMAGLHGTTGTSNRAVQVNEGFSDVFHSLNFALMGVFEARKDKWVILTDAEYVSLEDDKATPGPLFSSVNAKVKLFIFNPEVGYRFFENSDTGNFVEVDGGIRIWHINTDFIFAPGFLPGTQVDASRTWVDAVGGLRGRAALSGRVFLTGKFDLGGGGSKFTYHFFGGGGYAATPRVALILGYRVLDVDYNKNNFVYDVNQRGPIVGVGFKL